MKPSHLKTPRTVGEGNFATGYTSAAFKRTNPDTLIVVSCVLALFALIACLL